MQSMSFAKTLHHAWMAYVHNARLLAFFSVPFLVAFPLALLLPNYTALSGIFLRPDTIGAAASPTVLGFTIAIALVSLLLYSFSLAAVNTVVRAQRTLVNLKNLDFELVEEATFRIFGVMLLVFALIFAFTLLAMQFGPNGTASLLARAAFAFVISLGALFAPQAIVIDRASVENAITSSIKIIQLKPAYAIGFLAVAMVLVGLNTAIFTALQSWVFFAPLVGLGVNALVIAPFLEVLKVQIFLSKYTLL